MLSTASDICMFGAVAANIEGWVHGAASTQSLSEFQWRPLVAGSRPGFRTCVHSTRAEPVIGRPDIRNSLGRFPRVRRTRTPACRVVTAYRHACRSRLTSVTGHHVRAEARAHHPQRAERDVCL